MNNYLNAKAFMEHLRNNTFKLVHSIDYCHISQFRHDRNLFVKVPHAKGDEGNPYDGYQWTRRRLNEGRHQVTYTKMTVFGEDCQSMRCTDFTNPAIRKQVITFQGFKYCYYFTTHAECIIHRPEDAPGYAEIKRADKKVLAELKAEILPFRSVGAALQICREKGHALTRKQIQNAARHVKTAVVAKCGPKSRTTLKMAEELKALYPDMLISTDDGGLLKDLTLVHVFPEACRVFNRSCPTLDEYDRWIRFVDSLQHEDPDKRREALKKTLAESRNGLFFASRLHIDTTFDLSDVYVTLALAETTSFVTKPTKKPRVIPLGFMIHSSKRRENHEIFAEALKQELEKQEDPLNKRRIPCCVVDGETALESYSEILNAKLQRCDVHILSILKHNHGGKAAADDAQPYIFGRMKEGKWCSGILGCFTIEKFEERLKKCRGKIHPKIYHWLNSNKTMLMESASAFAKLKCGHILQYSTNNQNENFNAQLKAVINKRQDAHLLQQQLVTFCKAKLKELYLSTIDGSDYVLFTQDIVSKSSDEKYDALNRLGLQGSLVFAFGIPLPVAERLDIDLQVAEEQKTVYLQIIDTSSSGFCVKESGAKPAYANVTWKNDTFECELCGDTLPAFLCRHLLQCIPMMPRLRLEAYWRSLSKGKRAHLMAYTKRRVSKAEVDRLRRRSKRNALPSNCGSKPKNRFGKKGSSYNHTRRITDVSSLSVFGQPDTSASTTQTLSLSTRSQSPFVRATSPSYSSHNNTPIDQNLSSPGNSSNNISFSPALTSTPNKRRSVRDRRAVRQYTPPSQSSYNRRSSGSCTSLSIDIASSST